MEPSVLEMVRALISQGVAVVALAALAWFIWTVWRWVQQKADLLVAAHLELIKTLQAEQRRQTEALLSIAESLRGTHEPPLPP